MMDETSIGPYLSPSIPIPGVSKSLLSWGKKRKHTCSMDFYDLHEKIKRFPVRWLQQNQGFDDVPSFFH